MVPTLEGFATFPTERKSNKRCSSRGAASCTTLALCGNSVPTSSTNEDPDKVEELISLLQAIMRDDQEEVRTRMSFLVKKYANVISDSKAAD